jgi:hypothetical protein
MVRADIARVLGFAWTPAVELSISLHGTRIDDAPGEAGALPAEWDRGTQHRPSARRPPVDDSRPVRVLPLMEDPPGVSEADDFAWLDSYGKQEVAAPRGVSTGPVPSPPLFRRNWQRGILQAATQLVEDSGEVDIPVLVRQSAARRALARMPRRLRPTLRHGVQVLLDTSRSMVPFQADQDQLLRGLQRLFPRSRCELFSFLESPSRGVIAADDVASVDYTPPDRPRVVLIVSDFGAAPARAEATPATVDEWLLFADRLRDAGCPFVALSPYPRERWPRALAQRADIIPWDRDTNVAGVARTRRNRQ